MPFPDHKMQGRIFLKEQCEKIFHRQTGGGRGLLQGRFPAGFPSGTGASRRRLFWGICGKSGFLPGKAPVFPAGTPFLHGILFHSFSPNRFLTVEKL
ncbi:hypothetical protein B5F54_14390 [Anaeromassilibacillus sp. An250]|nr:hypothetical protein B5F54_14390 [Anaeromassilibacillus sp. An250]